ncbi:hypothetical protein [Cerasicoccus arenae]|uniref:Uncharacterized protein n=1 Tax=Cerasicoccus arenae TaxID=424488 RepID=A0A8J3DL79_9BACT|nr:hypothetical protein [Cerasicoccus arenae]MBK1858031.1 hypothetical protein [Cerasicoccus arenae]GHC06621.1 hypothetical protein GCM10007047_24540 [Cerasicoccus arenae]
MKNGLNKIVNICFKAWLMSALLAVSVVSAYAEDCECDTNGDGNLDGMAQYDCDGDGTNESCDPCEGCDCDGDGSTSVDECDLDTDEDGVDDECLSCSTVTIEFRQGAAGTGADSSGGGSSTSTSSIDVIKNGEEEVVVYVSPESAAGDVVLEGQGGVSFSGSAGGTVTVSIGESGGSLIAKINDETCATLSVTAADADVDIVLVP